MSQTIGPDAIDPTGRMESSTYNGNRANFRYIALGERVSQTVDGIAKLFELVPMVPALPGDIYLLITEQVLHRVANLG